MVLAVAVAATSGYGPGPPRARLRRISELLASSISSFWGLDESCHWVQSEALGAPIETVSTTRWPDRGGQYLSAIRVSAG